MSLKALPKAATSGRQLSGILIFLEPSFQEQLVGTEAFLFLLLN